MSADKREWANEQDPEEEMFSVMTISRRGRKPKIQGNLEINGEKFGMAADQDQAMERYSEGAFGQKFEFNEAVLLGGKLISLVQGEYDPEIDASPMHIEYEGKRLSGEDVVDVSYFKQRILIKSLPDDGRRVSAYSVIDCGALAGDGAEPVATEIHSSTSLICFMVETRTGKYWWNTQDTLFREGIPQLTIPDSVGKEIRNFEIYKDYIVLDVYCTVPITSADGHEMRHAVAVYHRKSGAQVLFFPYETLGTKRPVLMELTPGLSLLTISGDLNADLTCWLISEKTASSAVTVHKSKIMPETDEILIVGHFVCLKARPHVRVLIEWIPSW